MMQENQTHNEVENALLARMIAEGGSLQGLAIVGPSDFINELPRQLAGFVWLYAKKGKIPLPIIWEECRKIKLLPYLNGILEKYKGTALDIGQLADKVLEESKKVRLQKVLHDALAELEKEGADKTAIKIKTGLKSIEGSSDQNSAKIIKPVVEEFEEQFLMSLENPEQAERTEVMTGIRPIDINMGGVEKNEMVYYLAGSTHGKSMAKGQIALETARRGEPVAFYSLETPKEKVVRRFISYVSGYSINEIKKREPNHGDKEKFKREVMAATKEVKSLPIFIYDGSTRFETIQADTYKKYGEGVNHFFFDFLQLITGLTAKGTKTHEHILKVAYGLKGIQKDCEGQTIFHVGVQAASSAIREMRMPRSNEIQGCQDAKQAADRVICMNIPSKYNAGREGIIEFKQDKNRDGTPAMADCKITKGMRLIGVDEEFGEDAPF